MSDFCCSRIRHIIHQINQRWSKESKMSQMPKSSKAYSCLAETPVCRYRRKRTTTAMQAQLETRDGRAEMQSDFVRQSFCLWTTGSWCRNLKWQSDWAVASLERCACPAAKGPELRGASAKMFMRESCVAQASARPSLRNFPAMTDPCSGSRASSRPPGSEPWLIHGGLRPDHM